MADKGLCVLAPLREPAVFLFFILGVPPEEVFHTSGVGLSATSPRYAVGFTLLSLTRTPLSVLCVFCHAEPVEASLRPLRLNVFLVYLCALSVSVVNLSAFSA